MIKAIGTAARRELERELGTAGPPRPVGPRAPRLARRRRAAGPPRHRVARSAPGSVRRGAAHTVAAVTEPTTDVLLIGGGIASANAAAELRERGFDGSILLATRELDPPYHRPPITKGYLQRREDRESTLIHPEAWYAAHDVEVRTRAARHGHRPRGAHRRRSGARLRRVRQGARRHGRRRAPAAGRGRPARRDPLPARAAQRRAI